MERAALWVDKQAYYVIAIIPTAIMSLMIYGITKAWSEDDRAGLVGTGLGALAVVFLCLTSFHYLPLRIYNDRIRLASGKFPSVGRKDLPFKDIRKINVTVSKRWDEGRSFLEFIRVTDSSGNEYRNVIYSVSGFKAAIKGLIAEGLITDASWLKDLPPRLR